MDELLSIPIHKELNVIQINIKECSFSTHKLENIPIRYQYFRITGTNLL